MLTREQSRQADENAIKKFCIPSLVLMENAGRSCAERLVSLFTEPSQSQQAVIVLCGPGNNGGDGFVIARHLYISGTKVKVVLCGSAEAYSGDARLNLRALSGLQIDVVELGSSWNEEELRNLFLQVDQIDTTWVVDALLGTGARGTPRGVIGQVITVANQMDVHRFAVDIPSGLDCDSGEPEATTFRADVTCTMIDLKVGFQNPNAAEFVGQTFVVGIGAPNEIMN